MSSIHDNNVIHITYDMEYHFEINTHPDDRTPETHTQLHTALNNPEHPDKLLINLLSYIPEPLFPLRNVYTEHRLKKMTIAQTQALCDYDTLLYNQRLNDACCLLCMHILDAHQPEPVRPLAQGRDDLLSQGPSEAETAIQKTTGKTRKQILSPFNDFQLTRTDTGDVLCEGTTRKTYLLPSLHDLHEELLEHKPKQTDSEWNVFARQRITAIPRLLPQLAAYTRQTLSPVPFVVTWSADLIEDLLTTIDRDNRVEELTIVFDPEFRRHITQTLSDNVEDDQDRWLTAIDSFVLTHRHLDDSYPAFHLTVADYLDDKGDADSAQLVINGPSFMIGHDPETGAYQLHTTTLWSKTKTDDINALQLNHVPIGEPTPDWRQLEHLYELLIEWPSGTLPDPDPDNPPLHWGPDNKGRYYCDGSGFHHTQGHGFLSNALPGDCNFPHQIPCHIWHQGAFPVIDWLSTHCDNLQNS